MQPHWRHRSGLAAACLVPPQCRRTLRSVSAQRHLRVQQPRQRHWRQQQTAAAAAAGSGSGTSRGWH